MFDLNTLTQPAWQPLTLTLLHFVWQAAAVAGLLQLVTALVPPRSCHTRYAASLVAFAVIMFCPMVTFLLIARADSASSASIASTRPMVRSYAHGDHEQTAMAIEGRLAEPRVLPSESGASPLPVETADSIATATPRPWFEQMKRTLDALQPWGLAVWLIGAVALSSRLCTNAVLTRRLRRGRQPLDSTLGNRFANLASAVGMRRTPDMFLSSRVCQAMVIGYVRPIILLPASWTTQLPPDVLCAVIAHELAHIRRCDVWVILLQRITEALLFYHPVVWWLSRRLSRERELCCDAMAVQHTGSAVQYASALERIARQQCIARDLALTPSIGGKKMELLGRIKHVLCLEEGSRFANRAERSFAVPRGIVTAVWPLALGLGLVVASYTLLCRESASAQGANTESKTEASTGQHADAGGTVPAEQPAMRSVSDLASVDNITLKRLTREEARGKPRFQFSQDDHDALVKLAAMGFNIGVAVVQEHKGSHEDGDRPEIVSVSIVSRRDTDVEPATEEQMEGFVRDREELFESAVAQLRRIKTPVNLGWLFMTERSLVQMGGIKSVRGLVLHVPMLDDDALAALSNLPELEQIWLVGGDGLLSGPSIAGKTFLWTQLRLTEGSLRHLAACTKLESVHLMNFQLTERGLRSLSEIRELKTLKLSMTSVPDESGRLFQKWTQLEELDMGSSVPVSRDDITRLMTMPQLKRLSVRGMPFSDFHIVALTSGNRTMERIELHHCRISDQGLEALKMAKIDKIQLNDVEIEGTRLDAFQDASLHADRIVIARQGHASSGTIAHVQGGRIKGRLTEEMRHRGLALSPGTGRSILFDEWKPADGFFDKEPAPQPKREPSEDADDRAGPTVPESYGRGAYSSDTAGNGERMDRTRADGGNEGNAPVVFSGSVIDESGKPVANANVWLQAVHPSSPQRKLDTPTVIVGARSQADGQFRLELPTDWQLNQAFYRARPSLWASTANGGRGLLGVKILQTGDRTTDRVRDFRDLSVTLTHRTLAVQIVGPDGDPVSDATVVPFFTTRDHRLPMQFVPRSDVNGELALPLVADAEIEEVWITTAKFGIQLYRRWNEVLESRRGSEPLRLKLNPVARLTGKITSPVPDAARDGYLVAVTWGTRHDINAEPRGLARIIPKADGTYEIPMISAGKLRFSHGFRQVYHSERAETWPFFARTPAEREIELEPGKTATADIEISRGVLIRGTVRDRGTNEPMPHKPLLIYHGPSPDQWHYPESIQVSTNAMGQFETRVMAGLVRVEARDGEVPRSNHCEVLVPFGVDECELPVTLEATVPGPKSKEKAVH